MKVIFNKTIKEEIKRKSGTFVLNCICSFSFVFRYKNQNSLKENNNENYQFRTSLSFQSINQYIQTSIYFVYSLIKSGFKELSNQKLTFNTSGFLIYRLSHLVDFMEI